MAKPQSTTAFTKAYNALNPAQKRAVDTIEGPVMVVAGPGTGKTQILTLRIANILLTTDTPPDAILALTFTEAGVTAMRTRLLAIIGPTAYHVRIHTFHSFCNDIIQSYPNFFARLIGSQPLIDIDAYSFLRTLLDTIPTDHLRLFGDPYYHVPGIKKAISELKREALTPQMLRDSIEMRKKDLADSPDSFHTTGRYVGLMKGTVKEELGKLERSEELARVYEAYEEMLRAKKQYDFDDMILEVLRAFGKNKDFLQIIQEQFLYILADEHQDANTAQNTLLEQLSAFYDNPNLFLVGDEKQAIFSFQGASLEHFALFEKKYPQAIRITLTDAYRSGTRILDASHALMKAGDMEDARNPHLISRHPEPHLALIEERHFTSEDYELRYVTEDIVRKINEGVAPHEIAVLYRNNKDVDALARLLSIHGIAVTIGSDQNVLDDHRIRQMLAFMRAAVFPGDDIALTEVLHAPWSKIPSYDVFRIIHTARREHLDIHQVLASKKTLEKGGVQHIDAVIELTNVLAKLEKIAREEHARDFFDAVVRESGLLSFVLTHQRAAHTLATLRGLLSTLETRAKKMVGYTARDFLADIDLYDEYAIPIQKDSLTSATQGVRLMTAHRSKGLEFEHVYLIHVRDGKWGNTKNRSSFYIPQLVRGKEDDERRLLYVALTRAKLYVSISYGASTLEGKNAFPAQFLAEIPESLKTEIPTEEFEKNVDPSASFAAITADSASIEDVTLIQSLFTEQGLSVTALNNYLVCPWQYFYRNLVRIPDVQSKSLMFGNAMHAGLQQFFEEYRTSEKLPSEKKLTASVIEAIAQQGFTKEGLVEAETKAKKAIPLWYAARTHDLVPTVRTEVPFEVFVPVDSIPQQRLLLRGKIDRIDTMPQGNVRVIDYKTGKPKTRGEIEGTTQSSDGGYFRQLTFYRLLLELKGETLSMEMAIDFLEPDAKGKSHYEMFTVDDVKVSELRETLRRVADEIYNLKFWESECDDKHCHYCALRKGMKE